MNESSDPQREVCHVYLDVSRIHLSGSPCRAEAGRHEGPYEGHLRTGERIEKFLPHMVA